MEIIKIAVLILITIVITSGLPTFNREITVFITFSGCIVVVLYTLNQIIPAIEYIKQLAQNIAFEGMEMVIKAVGVGFITQFVSDIAADSNNKALANQMIFTGRIAILILAMPLFMDVLEIVERLT